MTLRDFSKPGSWASRLYDILRPAPHPMAVQFSNSQSRFRHSTGEIWRHALSCSVYHDLLGDRDTNKNIAPTNRACRRRTWRRFVRIECIGLSGLLFYEIRAPASSVCDSPRIHEGRPILTGNEQCKYDLTVENVFGDPDDPDDAGMEVDDLLDAVHARVVYFPAYACTSFIIGHAMTAFFRDQPSFRPRPAPEGFSVPSSETMEEVHLLSEPDVRAKDSHECTIAKSEPVLLPSCSWQAICGDLEILDRLALEPDDPHVTLCVRSSIRSDAGSSCHASSDEEEGNTTSSTIDSLGPSTPPPGTTRSGAEDAFTPIDHPFNDRSLSMSANDRPIGFNLPTGTKPLMKSPEPLPAFTTSGNGTCVPVDHKLASFLDLSISYVEMNKENYPEPSNS